MRAEVNELWAIAAVARRVLGGLPGDLRRRLAGALALMGLGAAFANGPPVLLGALVDRVIGAGAAFDVAWPYLAAIVACVLCRAGVEVGRRYLVEDAATRLELEATVDLISRLLLAELAFFRTLPSGALNGRARRAVEGLVRVVKLVFLDLMPALLVAVFALTIVLLKEPALALVMSAVVPLGFIIILRQVTSQKGVRVSLLREHERIDGVVVELFQSIEGVRALGAAGWELQRVEGAAESLRATSIAHHLAMACFDALKLVNEGAFRAAVIAAAVLMAVAGDVSPGDIMTYVLLYDGIVAPLREVHRILDEGSEGAIRVEDLFRLRDVPAAEEVCSPPPAAVASAGRRATLALSLQGLRLQYPGADAPALDGVTLDIARGERVGICGRSGGGKSSLFRAILRLYPVEGRVLVHGVDARSMPRERLADLVGYVGQSPLVMTGTIAENIAYGLPRISAAAIEEAARLANLHEEIRGMPEGYGTRVGPGGLTLAGGQRQRLSIARALLRRPRVLLLDEATAALDNLNEERVLEAIHRIMRGRTVLSIAHRLSTLRDADRIVVLDGGAISEQGTFSELQRRGGLFADLLSAGRGVVARELADT